MSLGTVDESRMAESAKNALRPVVITARWGHGSITPTKGRFHRWGEKLNSITDGVTKLYGAAEVVGIVETEDGNVHEVPASHIRFLDRTYAAEDWQP